MKVLSDENTNKRLLDIGIATPIDFDSEEEARIFCERVNATNTGVAVIKENKVEVKQLLVD